MADINFDELHASWKRALDNLVDALRAEESLVTPEHSMVADEQWDAAQFKIDDAEKQLNASRDAYKDALRQKNYGF